MNILTMTRIINISTPLIILSIKKFFIKLKNPFNFEMQGLLINDSKGREAVSKSDMRKFLDFVYEDNAYCKYYEAFYILFHTGLRISEFCGLTVKDIDFVNNTINVDKQLQRLGMKYVIVTTKTNAGTRVLPMTSDVAECFRAIIDERQISMKEPAIDGVRGFLFLDENQMPLVAMHWQHRMKNAWNRYNTSTITKASKTTARNVLRKL